MSDSKYPGSKQTRRLVRSEPPKVDEPEVEEWREHYRDFTVNGERRRFYTVRALGMALGGREPATLRKWERNGWLPAATFRTSGKKQDRLYTEAQVLGLMALVQDEGLMNAEKRKPVGKTSFPERAHTLFDRLAAA